MFDDLFILALTWLRGTLEVHDEMDEMKQEQESMKLVPKVGIQHKKFNDMCHLLILIFEF